MGEVVNLRLARKAAARKDKEAQAAANRAAHGRTRAERAASKAEVERAARLLDGAKREGRD
ncbi:MAG: DUF4169 family protein [Novosphingobium sp.]|nr:DUF4169 family protein [Novosphingobium sp.]